MTPAQNPTEAPLKTPMASLPPGVKLRSLPKWARFREGRDRPQYQYRFPSGVTVVQCDTPEGTVIFTGGQGEFHIFRAQPETARQIIATIREEILPLDYDENAPLWRRVFGRPVRQTRYPVGDEIEIVYSLGRWGLRKLGQGMAPSLAKKAELRALASVLDHILQA